MAVQGPALWSSQPSGEADNEEWSDSSTTGSKLDPGGGSTQALGWGTETLQGRRNSGWFWKDKQESSRPQRQVFPGLGKSLCMEFPGTG